MKKKNTNEEQVKLLNEIEEEAFLTKYATNIENLFVYKVQNGAGMLPSLKKSRKSENKIVMSYKDKIDGQYCGIVDYYITRGLIGKYKIKVKKYWLTIEKSFLNMRYEINLIDNT